MAKKDELTKKIIQAAVLEFTSKGLDSGSMENIASTASVSKRTLYKYFPNKEAIFDSLIDMLLGCFKEYSDVTYSKTEPIEKQIEKIIDAKIELITSPEHMDISRLVLSEVMKGRKLNAEHMKKFYETEEKFLKWIDAAKKDGKIKSKQPSELISNQVHSIVKGQVFYPVLFGMVDKIGKTEAKTAKKIAVEFFLNSFCHNS